MNENKGYTIQEASEIIGVSSRQVRRYIKQGKIEASLTQGKFGEEYRIPTIPDDMLKGKSLKSPGAMSRDDTDKVTPKPVDTLDFTVGDPPDIVAAEEREAIDITSNKMALEIINRLEEENRNLAGQLGMVQARVKQLEGELRLLESGRKPSWWRRVLRL